jgi:hypothetical protein
MTDTCRGRARGWEGRAAELARTPSWHARRAHARIRDPVQGFQESPSDAKGVRAATGGWPRCRPDVSSNCGAPATTLPLHRLDRDPERDPETPAAPYQPTWGFAPFLRAPPREMGRVEAGEERSRVSRHRWRAAAGGRS